MVFDCRPSVVYCLEIEMKRWVVMNDEGQLEIHTTGGHEPAGALCEAKLDWTIYNISYDPEVKLVYYDPEKQVRHMAELEKQEQKRIEQKKLEAIRIKISEEIGQIEDFIAKHWKAALGLAIGIAIGIGVVKYLH